MKRNAFDERRDLQIANEYGASQMPCTFCSRQTDVGTLNTYGARCFDCYQEYISQGKHYPALSLQDRRDMGAAVSAALLGGARVPGQQHIANLRARADAGERLTAGQRGFLDAATTPLTETPA